MSWIPAALVPAGADRTPVTVWLTPAQAMRLELMLAAMRERDPSCDDNAVVDQVFATGLALLSNIPESKIDPINPSPGRRQSSWPV